MKEYFATTARYLKLDIAIPYQQMYEEARALKDRYTTHRGDGDIHNGWKSLALYGLDENKHETWEEYGYKNGAEAAKDFKWTAAADKCPVTMNWLLTTFPCKQYGRVRFMLVEAGGHIGMHTDCTKGYMTENTNIALNNPVDCIWKWGDGAEDFIMEPGGVYAMNISYPHSIVNNSNEDRFHLIVARHDSTPEWKSLLNQAAANQNETGEYFTLPPEVLP
jgi:hypothetical protein